MDFHRRLIGSVSTLQLHAGQILGRLADTTGPQARAIRQSGRGDCGYLAYDEKVADTAVEWLQGQKADRDAFMMTVDFVQPQAPFVARPTALMIHMIR